MSPLPFFASYILLTASALFISISSLEAQTTTAWDLHKTADGLHPDGNEQEMLWLMNRARANPTAEGVFLANSGNADINLGISFFNVNVALMQQEFAAIPAKPPAAFDRRLYEASRDHSLALIARDSQDHDGQFALVDASGFKKTFANVSVFAFANGPLAAHGALNIDWGPGGTGGMQSGRGHRVAIMSTNSALTNVGLAMVPDNNPGTEVGPFVFSGAYCGADTAFPNHYNRFLVGTVWRDNNSNGRYDAGEGLNNVRVQPGNGTFHAFTGIAGGYAIPATAVGAVTLTISGGTLAGTITKTATVGASSVLVDVLVTTTPAAQPMAVTSVVRAPNGNLTLQWTGGNAPYQVQRSTTLLQGSWQNVGNPVSTTSATVTPTGTKAFYRVTGS
ncbi:MAG: hypothetical protein JWL81_1110 [Verrucomicrobiales bacterium]|nr:hypothetical protein [Verrucomicrobiales bacterium]